MASMVQIGVAHGGVLTHDVHAANFVRIGILGQRLVHDFNHGVAGLLVEGCVPKLFKPIMRIRVANGLIVGVHHGNETRIAGTLHIVLTAQWMQARTRLANLPSHSDQGNEATRIVGAMHVLADAHAPKNHGRFAGGKFPGDFPDRFCRDAANGGHGFGAVALNVLLQRFVVVGAGLYKFLIGQALFYHGVNQCIEHGHIGIGLELQGAPSMLANVCDARIGQHNFGTAFGRIFHPSSRHGVVGRGVGADDKNQPSVFDVIHLIAHGRRAHTL